MKKAVEVIILQKKITGLPNISIVKSVFTHCSKGMIQDENARLTLFQEFIYFTQAEN